MRRFSELAGIFAALAIFLGTLIAAESYISDRHNLRADLVDVDE